VYSPYYWEHSNDKVQFADFIPNRTVCGLVSGESVSILVITKVTSALPPITNSESPSCSSSSGFTRQPSGSKSE